MARFALSRFDRSSKEKALNRSVFLRAVRSRRVVARHEIVEIAASQRVFLEREVHVRPQVVDTELLGPWLLGAGLRSKITTSAFPPWA